MATTVNALRLRKVLGRDWSVPEQFGPDGWRLFHLEGGVVLVTAAAFDDGLEFIHASMTWPGRVPTYEELTVLHRAAFGDGWAYQVFSPTRSHVNIHENALHLWGRLDGQPWIPDFSAFSAEAFGLRSI